jgi:TonB family protein
MLNKKSPRSSFMKLLTLVPIVCVALALNAETVNDYVYQQPPKKIVKKGNKNATAKIGKNSVKVITDTVSKVRIDNPEDSIQKEVKEVFTPVEKNPEFFDVVEQMPEFPGGSAALIEYLSKNIRYPKAAMEADVQGRVIVNFVVLKDGSIGETKVVKTVSPELDEEALRCVQSMPKWKPGMQKGQPVNVKYTMPINFRLDGAKKEAAAKE